MLKTVEIPLSGHPDKMCDRIVEAILDEYLRRDEKSRVDIQALGSHGMIMIGGSVDSRADFDSASIIQKVYKNIGNQDELEPFINIERPSEDVAKIVVAGGSQGTTVVHGYATRETREMMPLAYVYASALARRIDDLRRTDEAFQWLLPDGKVQLTMDGKRPVSVTVLVQHAPKMELAQMQMALVDTVITPIIGEVDGLRMYVNSSGSFCTGGFSACAGASGRKTLADTYGGLLPSGGGAISGKDPLKPSRAGSLMARYAAKNIVASGAVGNILIKVGYSIGQQEPIFIEAVGGKGENLSKLVKDKYDFRPEAIVERLDLRKPIYQDVANYGYFGRAGVSWERIEK